MNDHELARVNTLDRFEADLADFEQQLVQVRQLTDYAEDYKEPSYFIGVRIKIRDMLNSIEQARHFIEVKRAAVEAMASDVETLFPDDRLERRLGELQADRHLRGEDIAG